MDAERVDHHEHNADQRDKENVDERVKEFLDVLTNLLELAERLAAALIFEDGVRKFERVADAVGVDLGTESLSDDVQEVVLEIFGHAGDEGYTYCSQEKESDAVEELG